MKKNKAGLIVSVFLFSAGLAIGLAFSSMALWANLEGLAFWGYPESISYDPDLTREAEISRLQCPVLLTNGEVGTVKLPVSNPNETPTRAFIKGHISMPGRLENMVRRTRETSLEPGGESEVRWQVTTENTIYEHMILVRVFLQLSQNHPPSQTQHCGIVSADLWGLSSSQLLILIVVSSFSLMLAGIYLWLRASSEGIRQTNLFFKSMLVIGSLTVVTLISSLFRIWEVGLFAIILMPIYIFSVVSYHFGKLNS